MAPEKDEMFNDLDWERWYAPVAPPTWVQRESAKYPCKPVDWDNSVRCDGKDYSMLYRTHVENGKIVTHLRPGSMRPVEGWLRQIPEPAAERDEK